MAITVRAGVMPGTLDDYTLQDGASSLRDLLSALTTRLRERGEREFDPAGFDIRLNNNPVTQEQAAGTLLTNNAMVLLVKKVKGNEARELQRDFRIRLSMLCVRARAFFYGRSH